MRDKPDIYHFDRRLKSAYSLLDRSSIKDEDKELIKRFISHLKAQDVGTARLAKYTFTLKVIGENLGVSFEEAGRPDIERFVGWLHDQGYSPQTVSDYTFFLKRFFKFVRSGNVDLETPYPDEVRWLKKRIKLCETTKPRFLSAEEVKAMIGIAEKTRDKAMLSVGFEAGLRASELLGLNIGDVTFDQRGARVRIRGKTGERIVRLVSSSPMLGRYLETHPLRASPEAPLWLTAARNVKDTRLSWVQWNKSIKGLAERSGIRRRIHNHLLRHGSATLNARFLTDAEMRIMYGWTMDSKMPSVYIHLNGGDLDDKLTRIHSGQPLVPIKPEFSMVICPKCNENNSPGGTYCARCGTPLTLVELAKGTVEDEQVRREVSELRKLFGELAAQRAQGRQEASGGQSV